MESNRIIGNHFEDDFAETLFEKGFWVHKLQQNQAGQPADIVAVKYRKALLIDCKVCTNDKFPLSRIEGNQHLAMDLWRESGNGEAWFALKIYDDYVFMLTHKQMSDFMAEGKSTLNAIDIIEYGVPFGKWVKKCK